MLAHLNVCILSLWLIAEIVPVLADTLASREISQHSLRKDD